MAEKEWLGERMAESPSRRAVGEAHTFRAHIPSHVIAADTPGSSPWPKAASIDERPTTLRGAFCGFQCGLALVHLQADQFVESAAVDPIAAAMIAANDNSIERIRRQVFRRPRANGTLHDEPPRLLVYNMPDADMAVNSELWGFQAMCRTPRGGGGAKAPCRALPGWGWLRGCAAVRAGSGPLSLMLPGHLCCLGIGAG
jgi:hypothetical protein